MYLDPETLIPGEYASEYYDKGHVLALTNVQDIRILPLMTEDASAYYYTPGTDYTADLTGTNGTVTFIAPGPYTVLTTQTDGSKTMMAMDIGVKERSIRVVPTGAGAKTANAPKVIAKPNGGDLVFVDGNFFADMTAADYGGNPSLFTFTSWKSVTDYLQTLPKACHVELDGHGAPGIFSWNGEVVLKNGSAETQAWLDSMKGHIKNLTFISCAVGQGSEGDGLLQMVTSTLGASGAYTEVIGAFGEPGSKTWYILNNGTYKVTPEPATLGFLAIGGLGLLFFSRRHAR